MNRGVGLGLQIPVNYFFMDWEIFVNYFFYEDARVTTWVKNNLEKLDNDLRVKVKKCVK